jgi:hypothetical protein
MTGVEQPAGGEKARYLIDEAISHYEVASRVLGGRQVKPARAE